MGISLSSLNSQLTPVATTSTVPTGATAPAVTDSVGGFLDSSSGITALYDTSGNYVGSYGVDPSTGEFSVWDANGNETSVEQILDSQNISNGLVPVSADAKAGVLYNAQGQYVGLDVAGYVYSSDTVVNSSVTCTGVYNVNGKIIGYTGFDSGSGNYALWDASGNETDATTLLENAGISSTTIADAEALASGEAPDTQEYTDAQAAVQATLERHLLAQGESSLGTVSTAVYNSSGDYVGSFGGDGGGNYQVAFADGVTSDNYASNALQLAGLSDSDGNDALSMLTESVQTSDAGLASLQSVDDALSAYLLSEGADTQLLTNIVNVSDAGGSYVGVIGDDANSLQFAVQTAGGSVIDANAFLLSSGFTQEQIDDAQLLQSSLIVSPASNSAGAADLRSISAALESYLVNSVNNSVDLEGMSPGDVSDLSLGQLATLSGNQLRSLTSSQLNALTTAELASLGLAVGSFTASQVSEFTGAQFSAFSTSQIQALDISGMGGDQLAALSTPALQALSTTQIAALTNDQVSGLGVAIASLSSTQLLSLSATQLGALTSDQIDAFTSADQATALLSSVAQVQAEAPVAGPTPVPPYLPAEPAESVAPIWQWVVATGMGVAGSIACLPGAAASIICGAVGSSIGTYITSGSGPTDATFNFWDGSAWNSVDVSASYPDAPAGQQYSVTGDYDSSTNTVTVTVVPN